MERVAVGVLVSGAGTNLRALLDASQAQSYPARVALVISNRRSAGALDVARDQGVEAIALPVGDFGGDLAARDAAIRDALQHAGVRLVVCAGYDRVLTAAVLDAYPDAILNVHPSLLPAFAGGMRAVEDALAFGAKVSGCTVQLLEPGVPDGGPVVLQAAVPVHEDDDADSLRMRIHEQEWRILPEAVALWSGGRLRRDGRTVRILSPDLQPTSGGRPIP
ncbi:MAG TPA: phosphoribosylglycinamide formyltransferase [Candidatus Dormibacteraeota bacterium]|nr:phosphoribosylglycinamide formyltransferase [Candidatus Dormibacteraeota bacterium]